MNVKRFILASLAVFVLFIGFDFLVHVLILGPQYEAIKGIWRIDMDKFMWIINVAELLFAFVFVYAFTKGYEGKGILEGIRYGVIIWILVQVVGTVSQLVIYPIPKELALQWIGYGLVQYLVFGVVTSLIYKEK